MRDCSSMYCRLRVLLLSSCCRRLCTDLKKDSWVEGWAGWAVVLLGGARVELLGGVLFLGSEVFTVSSRGRLTGGATIVLLVLEELDRLPTVEVFTLSTLPLDPGVVVLVFFESSGWDARRCNCSELAVVTTELPGLGVVAADCEVEIDKLMSPGGTEPLEVTDDEVVVFTIKGPSSIGQVA